jgi:hypothetical protein
MNREEERAMAGTMDGLDVWAGPIMPTGAAELADHHAVCRLATTYSLGIDMRDYPLCRSAFTPDAEIEDRSGTMVSIDDLLPVLFNAAARYSATQHHITNQYVALNGKTARVWSYGLAYHRSTADAGGKSVTVGVIYQDLCRLYPQGWLIASRRVAIKWMDR